MLEHVYFLQPGSVLDVGCGFGKWGVLCREQLDIAALRWDKSSWATRIDGIEIFANYITPLHSYVYDNVYIGDALEIMPRLEYQYDLIIMGDVIEHLPKERGRRLIQAILSRHGALLLATPRQFVEQDAFCGNLAERHLSHWTTRDLQDYRYDWDICGPVIVVLLEGRATLELPPNWLSDFWCQLPGFKQDWRLAGFVKRGWVRSRQRLASVLRSPQRHRVDSDQ